jgi:hypothetical protein
MALPALSAQYFASVASAPNVASVGEGLLAYFEGGAGPFSYDPYRLALVAYLDGQITPEQALQYCATHGAKAGRNQNVAVTKLTFPFLSSRVGFSRKLKRDRYTFRRDLYVSVGPVVLCRDADAPVLIAVQPRKAWRAEDEAWRLWATLVASVHGGHDAPVLFHTDDVEPDIEILDLSADEDGIRHVVAHRYSRSELMREDELSRCLQNFADAHDALVARGYYPERKAARKLPPPQPGLFDHPTK